MEEKVEREREEDRGEGKKNTKGGKRDGGEMVVYRAKPLLLLAGDWGPTSCPQLPVSERREEDRETAREEGKEEEGGTERVDRRECVLLVSSAFGPFVSSLKLRPLPSPPVHSSLREGVQLGGTRLFE